MAQCSVCGSSLPDSTQFCPDCGQELTASPPVAPPRAPAPAAVPVSPQPIPHQPPPESTTSGTSPVPRLVSTATAKLTVKRGGATTSDSFRLTGSVIVGRFDADSGPVDVDLGPLPEADYVSRHHAQIWSDPAGRWFVKDLGSSNGTFVRNAGQAQFRRIAGDQEILSGDEIALGNARFLFETGI